MTATRHPACRASGGSCDSRRSWRSRASRHKRCWSRPVIMPGRLSLAGTAGERRWPTKHRTSLAACATCSSAAKHATRKPSMPCWRAVRRGYEWVRHFRRAGRAWAFGNVFPRRRGPGAAVDRERGPPGVRKFLWDRQLRNAPRILYRGLPCVDAGGYTGRRAGETIN